MEIWLVALILFASLMMALFLGLPVAFSCGRFSHFSLFVYLGGPGDYTRLQPQLMGR